MTKTKDTKKVVGLWHEAKRLAAECLADSPGLPDKSEVAAVACALLSAGLVGKGSSASSVDRAGQSADQEKMLEDAYSGADGNF
jgi:hypothetical protein